MDHIKIQGVKLHNLKNLNLIIPKNQLVVITGISGSGKSSLAFDIIFEEGKNQYLRSIGILSGLDKEERFDTIEGIGPTVAVRQNTTQQNNPRSTVGSKTSILNQLALVYACDADKLSKDKNHLSPGSFLYTTADGMCIDCQGKGSFFDVNFTQLVPNRSMTLIELYEKLKVTKGFLRILKNRYGEYFSTPVFKLPDDIREKVIYGEYTNGKQSYCVERILKSALQRGEDVEGVYEKTICPSCHGERINDEARDIKLYGKTIGELGQMTLSSLLEFIESIPEKKLSTFSKNVLKSLKKELQHLISFRLGHLSLYREMSSLSGGETQRILLHLHLKSHLDSLIYVFDEPMSGLHPSEKQSLIQAIMELREIGNTVIVVEHDYEMIRQADHIIEIGPKAGIEGGNVVYQGDYSGYKESNTVLSRYLFHPSKQPVYEGKGNEYDTIYEIKRTEYDTVYESETTEYDSITIKHANSNNLKDITVSFPLYTMVGIAGLSGSGKSTLIEDTLVKRLVNAKKYGNADGIVGAEKVNGVVVVSQEPIGRNSSSTPASYIGIWDKIRELFAKQPKAITQEMDAGYFSFHSKGACPDCGGSGYERIFLTSDFSVDKQCPTCHGKRYQEESLRITYNGKTITDILKMSITNAVTFFADQSSIVKPLRVLEQVGMGYLTLGQPTSSLSGGEAQRVKLAKVLGQQHKKNILYVLDEPTTGLSLYDIELLRKLLIELINRGNSVIVIEHNVEILKNCDYVIELGPEGGDQGGELIAKGTPQQLRNNPNSKTGRFFV